jgi:glutathione S-transferase
MIRLHYSSASEYVRKVMVVAIENGLADQIELIKDKKDLEQHNPLLKRPALVTADGMAIIDSPVICEYLDSLGGRGLYPPAGPSRWKAMTQQALADGIMEAITAIRVDRAYHAGQESQLWQHRQLLKIVQGFDAFESQAKSGALDGPVTIGHVTVGVLCEYADFQFAVFDWRSGRPSLAGWQRTFAQRPSMQATIPKQPPGRPSALTPEAVGVRKG